SMDERRLVNHSRATAWPHCVALGESSRSAANAVADVAGRNHLLCAQVEHRKRESLREWADFASLLLGESSRSAANAVADVAGRNHLLCAQVEHRKRESLREWADFASLLPASEGERLEIGDAAGRWHRPA